MLNKMLNQTVITVHYSRMLFIILKIYIDGHWQATSIEPDIEHQYWYTTANHFVENIASLSRSLSLLAL